ncbi:hypothetical protein LSCM4_03423 [Leishmania orientalis]|uniref:Uncharacterized protein n=1 Tax=Leishmania orientalis TaxID=2249476 RepID=A0A836KN41_9TRYP|nr:hypothetical protein LSCM4_03423 [Leishmania orientalis]
MSPLGTAMPMPTYIRLLRDNPFIFTAGKTAATGVLLCAGNPPYPRRRGGVPRDVRV